jgi:ABC-type transport system substrate-binding protein
MRKFKIGDKVNLRKDSRWYDGGETNPSDVRGTITRYRDIGLELPYTVDWDNGEYNSYSSSDLELWGHPINDLNKLLYPDYVEQDGLLVPKEKI